MPDGPAAGSSASVASVSGSISRRPARRREPVKVCVIGAGVAGLTAARRLAKLGHEVDVCERWPGLGGQVATMPIEGGDRLEHCLLYTSPSPRDS